MGFERIIPLMDKRIIKHFEAYGIRMELGVIQENGALKTDSFPIEIPDGEYLFSKTAQERSPESGDRVIVHWMTNRIGVVTDVLGSGSIFDDPDENFDEEDEDEEDVNDLDGDSEDSDE